MDRLSDLPTEILQQILYYLSQEDAVRTSVLSKSWRYNWCTRRNLDLSEKTFRGRTVGLRKRRFLSTVDMILQRYRDQSLRLEEFHLYIRIGYWDTESVSLLEKWIPLLTTMGVKDFHLSSATCFGRPDSPNEVFGSETLRPLLSVVFGSESLTHLHVECYKLDQKAIETIRLCKNLKSLRLERVYIDDSVLQKIFASCPLIETLCIVKRYCKGQTAIKINDLHHLKHVSLSEVKYGPASLEQEQERCSIEIYPPSLETININDCNILFHKGADFLNLNELYLGGGMKSSLEHLSSSKFPSLKRLTLYRCDGLEEIDLFIDAPNILHFEYWGSFVPSISFATTSNEWKSDIHLHSENASSLCFHKLYELLKSLSESEISLNLKIDRNYGAIIQENFVAPDIGYNKPFVVESLGLSCPPSSFSSLLNAAFCICRPRKMVDYWNLQLMEFVTLMSNSGNKDPLPQLLFRDLEEVSFEIMDLNDKGWHPAHFSEIFVPTPFSEVFAVHCEGRQCRLALKWTETP